MPADQRIKAITADQRSSNRLALALDAACLLAVLAAFIYLVFSILSYAFQQDAATHAFAMLRQWRIPGFYDLRWNLSVTDCEIPLDLLSRSTLTCHGFPWTGYPLLAFSSGRWLGLGLRHLSLIGSLSGLAMLVTIAHQLWLATSSVRTWSLVTAIALLGFPMQMLIERSNLDIIIYLLLSLFCLLCWQSNLAAKLSCIMLGVILTALKIFPFFGVLAWGLKLLVDRQSRQDQRWLGVALLASQMVIFVYIMATLHSNMLVKGGQLGSHGMLALGYINIPLIKSLGLGKARLAIKALALTKFLSLAAGFGLALLHFGKQNLELTTNNQRNCLDARYSFSTIVVMTAIGICSYLSTINYDYRMVFLIPIIGILINNVFHNQLMQTGSRVIAIIVLGGTIYGWFLPLFAGSSSPSELVLPELIDEMAFTPFAIGVLAGILLTLILGHREQGQARSLRDKLGPNGTRGINGSLHP